MGGAHLSVTVQLQLILNKTLSLILRLRSNKYSIRSFPSSPSLGLGPSLPFPWLRLLCSPPPAVSSWLAHREFEPTRRQKGSIRPRDRKQHLPIIKAPSF